MFIKDGMDKFLEIEMFKFLPRLTIQNNMNHSHRNIQHIININFFIYVYWVNSHRIFDEELDNIKNVFIMIIHVT
jgi:hypothetical protein